MRTDTYCAHTSTITLTARDVKEASITLLRQVVRHNETRAVLCRG